MVKQIGFCALLIFFGMGITHAQKVTNVYATQDGNDILVNYTLEASSPCEVSLLLSQDNGLNWGTSLKKVSGDVGKKIYSGEKEIKWKVLEELEFLILSRFENFIQSGCC